MSPLTHATVQQIPANPMQVARGYTSGYCLKLFIFLKELNKIISKSRGYNLSRRKMSKLTSF